MFVLDVTNVKTSIEYFIKCKNYLIILYDNVN